MVLTCNNASKDWEEMANSKDPDQTAPIGSYRSSLYEQSDLGLCCWLVPIPKVTIFMVIIFFTVTQPPTIIPEMQVADTLYFIDDGERKVDLPCRAIGSKPLR